MELDITTNANAVFLYPLSQVRSSPVTPGRAAGGASSDSNSSSNESTPSSPISRIDSLNNLNEDLENEGNPQNSHSNAVLLVTVHLTIPSSVSPPKSIQSLIVLVTSIEFLSFPKGRYEQGQPFSNKITVEEAAGTRLSSGGIYRWEIAVPIPHTSAPYERTRYGSVRQRVSAKITFSGLLSRKMSVDKPLAFIAVPNKDSIEGFSWARTHAATTGHLGPFFIALRTQHLTVGGFLRAALVLDAPRPSLTLTSFTVKMIQQISVRSRDFPGVVESSLPSEVEFLKATPEELQNKDGETIESSWLVRLPNCNSIRSSSITGSDNAIHVKNNIEVHLSFLDTPFPFEKVDTSELDEQGRRLYHYRVSWFIIMPSCTLRWRSFRLPAYAMLDSDPVPSESREFYEGEKGISMEFCACGEDLDSLISYECEAESDLFTSALMQEEIKQFRQLAARHITSGQPIQGGTSFGFAESLEGQVLEETDEERKKRLQREKEANEYSAVEDEVGQIILFQDNSPGRIGACISCKA